MKTVFILKKKDKEEYTKSGGGFQITNNISKARLFKDTGDIVKHIRYFVKRGEKFEMHYRDYEVLECVLKIACREPALDYVLACRDKIKKERTAFEDGERKLRKRKEYEQYLSLKRKFEEDGCCSKKEI